MATKLKGGSECNGHGIYSKLLVENMEILPHINGSSTISGWMIQFKFNPHTWSGLLAMFQATNTHNPPLPGYKPSIFTAQTTHATKSANLASQLLFSSSTHSFHQGHHQHQPSHS
ncbi:hypothetical protein E4U60_003026 [Claviceps pazoutovae]|uniref:Uncharacterized protein n=1 Tax=Claviceps pazoutovae TaxID=1649127 RepID=A0A9P7SGE0_9HYPO|nr:hypothetical protein E4U60_003026 [Claviceps pazoutovae]